MKDDDLICNITVLSNIETCYHKELQQDVPDKVDVQDIIIIDNDLNDASPASVSAINNTNSSARPIDKALKKKRKNRYTTKGKRMKPIYKALKNYTDKLVNDAWFDKIKQK